MSVTKLLTVASQLVKVTVIQLGIARLLKFEDDMVICGSALVNDHVGKHSAIVLCAIAETECYSFRHMTITVVFAVNVPSRKCFLHIDSKPMRYGSFVNINT